MPCYCAFHVALMDSVAATSSMPSTVAISSMSSEDASSQVTPVKRRKVGRPAQAARAIKAMVDDAQRKLEDEVLEGIIDELKANRGRIM